MLGAVALAISFMPIIRYDPFLNFLNVIAVMALSLIQLKSAINPRLGNPFMARMVTSLVEIPIRLVQSLFTGFIPDTFKIVLRLKVDQALSRRLVWVVVGCLISLPLLLIFSLLFASADPRFGQTLGNFFGFFSVFDLLQNSIAQGLLTLVFTLISGAALTLILIDSNAWQDRPAEFPVRILSGYKTVTNTVFALVNGMFGLFLASQIGYMFGGQDNIKLDGFTYADYARRGFGELLAVAIISFVLIKLGEYFVVRFSEKYSFNFQILAGLWIVQVLAVAASALQRVLLYEQAYGLTFIRLYSHMAIILIGLIFAAYLAKVLLRSTSNLFHQFLLTFLSLALILINLINPAYLIGQDVMRSFDGKGKLDLVYLQTLDTDALDFQMQALDNRLVDNQITQNKDNEESLFRAVPSPYDGTNTPGKYAGIEQARLACKLQSKINAEKNYAWPSFSLPRSRLIAQGDKLDKIIKDRNYNCKTFQHGFED